MVHWDLHFNFFQFVLWHNDMYVVVSNGLHANWQSCVHRHGERVWWQTNLPNARCAATVCVCENATRNAMPIADIFWVQTFSSLFWMSHWWFVFLFFFFLVFAPHRTEWSQFDWIDYNCKRLAHSSQQSCAIVTHTHTLHEKVAITASTVVRGYTHEHTKTRIHIDIQITSYKIWL